MIPPKILLTEQHMDLNGGITRTEQWCVVDRYDFKKQIASFLFLNKNKRWQRGKCSMGVDRLYTFEQ